MVNKGDSIMAKTRRNLLKSSLLSLMMISTLVGCGRGGTDDNNKSNNGGNNESTSVDTIDALKDLADDLEFDENGEPILDEQVELSVWCIIGDPDKAVYEELIKKFNDEYSGMIHLNMTYQGHFQYYTSLETTYSTDFNESFPDVCVMHNEKTAQYARMGYLLPLDSMAEKTHINLDYSNVYENIDRVTKYNGARYAVPMDAHGFVTSVRQDIIKKNGLGFDNNTRFIPQTKAEYQTMLEKLRAKADSSEGLLVRTLAKGSDHEWKKVDSASFYPEYCQSTDPDGLGALYANGGSMASADGETITFQNNEGFKTYITDQVDRYNNRLMGPSGDQASAWFNTGNCVFFSEGPWYVSQTYTLAWNNSDFTKANETLHVTEEEANDEVYSKPYTATRPMNWWTLDEYKETENGKKWYGNGHAISLTKHIKSAKKAAAAQEFIEWFTQGKDADTEEYNLATWCTSGHIPAWKNVYASDEYKASLEKNLTLRALGDPAEIMSMEGLAYETTIFNALSSAISNVQAQLKTTAGCTKDQAIELMNKAAEEGQTALDLAKLIG